MKKVVAFLLAILIFVAPVTTFVKADVVIGDNDDIIVNENANILGRKLAMLESLSELALSGVTEYTISNATDVDTYLDSLWSEVNDAIEYLDSGEWVDDIPSNIASKYYTNLVKYRDIVNNRGEFLGFDLQNPATSLLKTYFANDTYGKKYTSTNLYQSLDMVRALSELSRNSNTPSPSPDPNYNQYIQEANGHGEYQFFWYNAINSNTFDELISYPTSNHSWCNLKNGTMQQFTFYNGYELGQSIQATDNILTLYINEINNRFYGNISDINIIGSSTFNEYYYFPRVIFTNNYQPYNGSITFISDGNASTTQFNNIEFGVYSYDADTLEDCLYRFTSRFRNINIYVNGEPWSIVGEISQSNPTLDIDGILKIYGNDNPQPYDLQPNTQIDYDQLYQVIYNAIRDNLPISQGDINYYDSHDTIYSPTIINNYGEEEGDESDLIDTILDYAVIPKFDTAIAQPMRQALTNGVVIMNTSITDVIPNEILLILGACFFLLLFAVVINRMIK